MNRIRDQEINGHQRFGFGRNWKSFLSILDDSRIQTAQESLKSQLKVADLKEKRFLDIGSGSGLFSLAARKLGAMVYSFDYDSLSVACTRELRNRYFPEDPQWKVEEGSVLDEDYLSTLDQFDIVYSWGVLHHTGSMWQAIDNAVAKVKPDGKLAIALYNKMEKRLGGSAMWWRIKGWYNRSPSFLRTIMECVYICLFTLRKSLTFQNPFKTIREYGTGNLRGMSFFHDVRDWLGGFPYEYATAGEVFNYLHDKHGLELIFLSTVSGTGNNQFTFHKKSPI